MDPSTQFSQCRERRTELPIFRGRRRRVWGVVVGLVAACGGTSGVENIVASDGSPSEFDSSFTEAATDATTAEPGDEAAAGPVDATVEDRTVPTRPSPRDGGVPPLTMTAHDSGVSANPPFDASALSTLTILALQKPNSPSCLAAGAGDAGDAANGADPALCCLPCILSNNCLDPGYQGGSCESVEAGLVLGHGVPLDNPTSSFTAHCRQILYDVFATTCMQQSLTETPCVCGDLDTSKHCEQAGAGDPSGPLYQEFKSFFDLLGTNDVVVPLIFQKFTVQNFGAGQANAILQCAAINQCDCF
jgi:hypothetical protein